MLDPGTASACGYRADPVTQNPHSETVTEGIRVQAAAVLREKHEQGHAERFVYAYRITLTNEGDRAARLLARHWIIVDADGHTEEVRGPGVVGEFPHLEPGASHSYWSFCPLPTSWGTMEGSYDFERDDGSRFTAMIGRFFLVPNAPALATAP